jgi:hypothetical protein
VWGGVQQRETHQPYGGGSGRRYVGSLMRSAGCCVECGRIVRRDADLLYRGDRSEAVRVMLCAARPPEFLPIVTLPRRGWGEGE